MSRKLNNARWVYMLGVPPTVLRFYQDFVLDLYNGTKPFEIKEKHGFSPSALSLHYLRLTGSPLNQDELRKQIIPQLEASGLIDYEKPEYGDRRSKWIYPLWQIEKKTK